MGYKSVGCGVSGFESADGAVADASGRTAGSPYSFERQNGAHVDCLGSDYHTETLGGFSDSLQQRHFSTDTAPRVTDLSYGSGTAEGGNHWLKGWFDGSARAYSIDPPRYLSLSVFRI
jgi:hypothetical protein